MLVCVVVLSGDHGIDHEYTKYSSVRHHGKNEYNKVTTLRDRVSAGYPSTVFLAVISRTLIGTVGA